MEMFWDSFDCEIQCEEIYTEDIDAVLEILHEIES